MTKALRILFAGGGTGGHVYPAIAVAEEFSRRQPGFEALFVGTRSGVEARAVPASGYGISFISSRGLRGRGASRKILPMAMLLVSVLQSAAIIRRFKPDVVYGSGGYASVAAVLAGYLLHRTIVLQEQNSVPGLANKWLAPLARRIFLGFENAAGYFRDGRKILVTGNPLRRSIIEEAGQDAVGEFGLSPDRQVLLVFGGSQGAATLNRAAAAYLRERPSLQGIVQTGRGGYEDVIEALRGEEGRVFIAEYIDDIEKAYAAADIALARAGALSVSELAAVGLPAVLVPYPHSVDDHQVINAQTLVERKGAVMIPDRELDSGSLARVLDPLLADGSRLDAMRTALEPMKGRRSAAEVADGIIELMAERRGGEVGAG